MSEEKVIHAVRIHGERWHPVVWCGQPKVDPRDTQVDLKLVTCTSCKVLFQERGR